jgi:outer membrane protein insertion porin family
VPRRLAALLPALAAAAWLTAAPAAAVRAQEPPPEPPPEEEIVAPDEPLVAEPPSDPQEPRIGPDAPGAPETTPELPADVEEEVEVLLPEAGPAPPAGGPEEPAPVVAAIEIRSDTPLTEPETAELRDLLAFGPGERLTGAVAARALRNLQVTGIASRIDLLTRPAAGALAAAGDVVAVVVLRANLLVDEVRIEGDTGELDRDLLYGAFVQRAGEPLIESRVVRGVYELQEILRREGFFEATVRVRPEIDEQRRRARVIYRIEAGPRAEVVELGFDGELGPFTPQELREPMRTEVGGAFRRQVAERDAERLETWLLEKGYRTARVDLPEVEYLPERDVVTVRYPLAVGPEVRVRVEGAPIKKLAKRDLIPFLGDESYDEALLLLAEKRVRTWYQEQGHYRVEVDAREEMVDGVLHVVVEIEPGPEYTLEELSFTGNDEVSDDTLRELVATQQAGLLTSLPLIGGGRLVDDVLAADVDNVRNYYLLNGYVDAEVGPPEIVESGDELRVTVPIEEGPQQQVDALSLSGVVAFDAGELRGELALEEGGPFHPRLLELSLNAIRARYRRDGYDSVQVSATTDWGPEHLRVDVSIRVLEGPQTVVDQIIVRGNERTETEVIRRALGLDPGEPVSRIRLLEAERSLYQLGIFSRAELELTPAPLGATTRDVVVRVEEGRVRSVRYGVSVEYNDDVSDFSYGGSVGFSHSNLFGKAIRLSADARVLSREEQYRLFVEQPTVGDLAVPVSYTLFSTEEQRASFRIMRRGVRIEARRELGDGVRLGLAYDYRIVENEPLDFTPADPADEDDLERVDQELRVAGLIPTFLIDHRNDPLYPSDGWTSLVQLQYAFPLLAAEADFLKLFLQHSQYVDLGFFVLALSGRVGGIEPLSPLPEDIEDPFIPPGAGLPSQDIFLAERFFAGGGSSHRGYGPDELGIPFSTCLGAGGEVVADCAASLFPDADGTLRAAGGNGLAILNADLRFPLFGPVEGVVFYDYGNVWADWRLIDFGDFRSGAGFELRYVSPVGPLRVGIGFPLDPIEGADDYVLFINLGSPF